MAVTTPELLVLQIPRVAAVRVLCGQLIPIGPLPVGIHQRSSRDEEEKPSPSHRGKRGYGLRRLTAD